MDFSDNKRIARNTILLYIRMLLLMAVSLYTSRVILAALGIDDYGIYNLIAGFISLFSVISNALVSAVQRFFNVALGEQDEDKFNRIYSMALNLFALFSIVILIIAETVGVWFVNQKLNIPSGRENAAFWVFQLSIATMIVQLFRTSDNAAIIAYEKMNFYAYLSVGEAVLKLLIVFALSLFDSDRLILYVLLYLVSTVLINIAYKAYCNIRLKNCHYHCIWDSTLCRQLLSFSGWNLLSNGTRVATLQGENFVLNNYYSVAVNAARGVASQVYNAVNLFLVNFQMAFKPQLVKTYAAGEMKSHFKLLFRTSKLSYYLLLAIILPVIFNIDILFSTWLKEVPGYTKEFCVFVLLAYLMDALSAPLQTSISAQGNIRGLQISISVIFVLQFIASFLALQNGSKPYIVSFFILCSHTLMFLSTLAFAKKICGVDIVGYLISVILPIIWVSVISLILPYLVRDFASNIWGALGICIMDFIWVCVVAFVVGLGKNDRNLAVGFIRSKFNVIH